MLPPALFEGELEITKDRPSSEDAQLAAIIEGKPSKKDPFGRDNPDRRQAGPGEWSAEPLAKFLQGIVSQIDTNLQNHSVPTSEKLDTFVSRLIANAHRQMKHAPKKIRKLLQEAFARRFQKVWNFVRNEKVRSISPEELRAALISLIETLTSEFGVNPDVLQVVNGPRPRRVGGSYFKVR